MATRAIQKRGKADLEVDCWASGAEPGQLMGVEDRQWLGLHSE